MPEVAALPVQELRLPLLAPSELATLETHNKRDLLIPVSCCCPLGCPGLPSGLKDAAGLRGNHTVAMLMATCLSPSP